MDVQHFKVVLTTPDPDRLIAFYRDVVGLAPAPARGPGEFDDVAAFGSYQARIADDAAFQDFIANRIQVAGGPITLAAAATRSELPI